MQKTAPNNDSMHVLFRAYGTVTKIGHVMGHKTISNKL